MSDLSNTTDEVNNGSEYYIEQEEEYKYVINVDGKPQMFADTLEIGKDGMKELAEMLISEQQPDTKAYYNSNIDGMYIEIIGYQSMSIVKWDHIIYRLSLVKLPKYSIAETNIDGNIEKQCVTVEQEQPSSYTYKLHLW